MAGGHFRSFGTHRLMAGAGSTALRSSARPSRQPSCLLSNVAGTVCVPDRRAQPRGRAEEAVPHRGRERALGPACVHPRSPWGLQPAEGRTGRPGALGVAWAPRNPPPCPRPPSTEHCPGSRGTQHGCRAQVVPEATEPQPRGIAFRDARASPAPTAGAREQCDGCPRRASPARRHPAPVLLRAGPRDGQEQDRRVSARGPCTLPAVAGAGAVGTASRGPLHHALPWERAPRTPSLTRPSARWRPLPLRSCRASAMLARLRLGRKPLGWKAPALSLPRPPRPPLHPGRRPAPARVPSATWWTPGRP